MQVAYEQADRLRRLLEQLLDLSRLDARGVARRRREPLVLRSVLGEDRRRQRPDGTPVELDVAAGPRRRRRPARARPRRLEPARQRGALRQPADRRLRRAARPAPAHRRRGRAATGVPDELRPRLFERFARGDDARGSGLGLTIARAYARAHGGDLVYEPGRRRALRAPVAACLTSQTSHQASGSGGCPIPTGGRGPTGGLSSRRPAWRLGERSCSSIPSRRRTTRTRYGTALTRSRRHSSSS